MGAGVAEEGEPIIRRRWPRMVAAGAALLALLLLGLWLERKPIARGQADRLLAQAGVPARYAIGDLGPGRQRLTNVVIGDPADPDLIADWLETRTGWGLRGPYLTGVRGGHVRVRARWADGRLSLGSIDKLLPKGKAGKPFALPPLALDVQDLRARVETPWGLLGAKLAGSGPLDGGFLGKLAVTSGRLAQGDCAATDVGAVMAVRTTRVMGRGRALLTGPVRATVATCAGAQVSFIGSELRAALTTGDRFAWGLDGRGATGAATFAGARAARLAGAFAVMSSDRVAASVDLAARQVVWRGARADQLSLRGDVAQRPDGLGFKGDVGLADGDARALLPRLEDVGQGTPAGPLVRRFASALRGAAERVDGEAKIEAVRSGGATRLQATGGWLDAPGGARLTMTDGPGVGWLPGSGVTLNGAIAVSGGGLPALDVRVARKEPNAPFAGLATLRQPYAAQDASVALTPVRFRVGPDGGALQTVATLAGPFADGRIDRLTVPIDARWRSGELALANGCVPVRWSSLAISGLRVGPARLRLCPTGEALATVRNGRVAGGARIAAARLTGRLGSTPLTLTLAGARAGLAERGFALSGLDARLGPPERVTRLTVGLLEGRFGPDGVAGRFAGGGGRIGAVPLMMTAAAGDWRFRQGMLVVDGGLTVSDAASPARFQPMAARGVTLRLHDNRIAAAGVLHEPTTGTKVADVAIRHDLGAGAGTADLTVAGLTFAKGFQPELLTRLTFGVIADVRGPVSGEGHIDWTPAGVSSTGVFRTAGADLAAAFGPVQGLAGEIRFIDLLALRSAPGQRLTVKSINPGVPVTDGAVLFQTLPGARVQVEGARWPFAGGTLTLDPTLLDFSGPAERRLTFRVAGAEADKFLQSFDLKNLNATGVFDGVLPMAFDASGGRIENGRLTVRPGGGTIAYVGDISQKNLGFWGNFAFDALRSLRYRSLNVVMNGPLAGEMVTEVRFAGVSQGEGAKSNFVIRRLQRLPFVFNIRIRAPFRGLLDATASFYDPKRLIERNLPELIRQQNKSIQPPASETVP